MKILIAFVSALALLIALSACGVDNSAWLREGNFSEPQKAVNQVAEKAAESPVLPEESLPEAESKAPEQSAAESNPEVPSAENRLSREEAIGIALAKAGLERSEVRDLEAELDREHGNLVWEVDFDRQNKDFSIDVDAVSGEVLFFEKEIDR